MVRVLLVCQLIVAIFPLVLIAAAPSRIVGFDVLLKAASCVSPGPLYKMSTVLDPLSFLYAVRTVQTSGERTARTM